MSDLIDRQRALDAFDYWVKSPMVGYSNGLLRLHEMLEEIPPVKPEPKRGKWEYVQYDGNPNIGNWHCSECHKIIDYKPLYKWEKEPEMKYCPNCGAKMFEPQEKEK